MEQEVTEKEYEDILSTLASPGWKLMVEESAKLAQALRNHAPEYATTNDVWQYTRGQIQQLDRMVNYETFIRAAMEQQEDDKNEVKTIHAPILI